MAIKTIAQLKSDVNTNITQNVGTRGITAPILGGEMIDTIDSLSAVDESLEERKANIDGSYDTMTVGLAKNLEGDIYVEGKTYFKPTATVVDDEGAFTSEEVGSGPATIETISGNTVVWNQQWKNTRESGSSFGGIRMIWVDSYSFYYTGTANTSNDITHTIGTKKGHKYYISVPNANDGLQLNNQKYSNNTIIMEAPGTALPFGVRFALGKTYSNSVIFKPIVFDLTLMFGYGNEPSTIEQFKDWLSKNVGLAPYYAYNTGTLINSKPTGIASIGYNLMDLDGTTGTARVPGKYDDGLYGSYYGIRGTYNSVSFVPAATGISEEVTPDSDGKFEISVPGDIVVSGAGSSTTVFMWYDGSYTEDSVEYEYTPTTGLDVTKIYGKANGSSTYTQVFPDGIKSINGIRDILDLKNGEATVKIGIFPNLGTLNWAPYSNNRFYSTGLDALVVSASKIFCTKYPSGSAAFDGCIYVGSGSGKTEIRDTTIEHSTAGANAIKASLANVKGYYVCLNPITYTELIVSNDGGETGVPVQAFNYTVDNWGLEELLPQNDYATANGIVTTAPILNVRYSIDAVEAINTINDEVADLYESKANTEGYYPELSVGLADNLKGNDAVIEEFFVRTSGGEAEVANGTASLDGVKGNSVKWNQLVQNGDFSNGITRWGTSMNYSIVNNVLIASSVAGSSNFVTKSVPTLPTGHIIYYSFRYKSNKAVSVQRHQSVLPTSLPIVDTLTKVTGISTVAGSTTNMYFYNYSSLEEGEWEFQLADFYEVDLTLLGIDNLTTPAQVEAWLAENIGTQSYYPYNAGEVTNVNMTGLESTGFNLLNPETHTAEIPGIYTEDYDNYYGITGTYTSVTFTPAATGIAENITSDIDEEGKVLIEEPGTITVTGDDSTTCVFLWWDGSQTESEPYVEPSVARIDVSHINGVVVSGSSTEAETIFPYGMCGIGDIKDEIFVEDGVVKAVKRIGVVDLGTLTWNTSAQNPNYTTRHAYDASVPNIFYPSDQSKRRDGIISDKFTVPTGTGNIDLSYGGNSLSTDNTMATANGKIWIRCDSYSNVVNFTQAMSGVMLYYELATPITYASLQYEGSSYFSNGTAVELPINYTVNNWGLERILPANTTSTILTAAPTLTCEYATDVLETINTINDEIDNINASLDEKADKVGAYPELMAGNLVDDTPSTGTFTYRKAGGDKSIASGTTIIDKISGQTLVWNQLISTSDIPATTTQGDITFTNNGDGSVSVSGTASADTYITIDKRTYIPVGHKGLFLCGFTGGSISTYYAAVNISNYNQIVSKGCVATTGASSNWRIRLYVISGANVSFKFTPMLFDLTLMFGAGNEPSTVGEFEALYPLDYYDYNEGTLINNNASAIETTGFNQWDEEWESGSLAPTTGLPSGNNDYIRSKNFIPIFGGTSYCVKRHNETGHVNFYLYFYDGNKNYLGAEFREPVYNTNEKIFTTPATARYAKITNQYQTYNHDICINLSDPVKNGTYEPYEKHTFYFDKVLQSEGSLATVTGKLLDNQGQPTGESVVVFPDGLKSAGSVYDEIKGNVAIKRVGSVDISTISSNDITMASDELGVRFSFMTYIIGGKSSGYNPKVCNKYQYVARSFRENPANGLLMENSSSSSSYIGFVVIYDSSYNSVSAFLSGNEGTMLYFELATPETYILDQTVTGGYQVNALGTEKRLPEDTASAVTAPIILTTRYSMDAVGTLNGLPTGYISESSMDAFLTEFASKIGAAINKTITATKTFNATTNKYNFTITITNPTT